MATIKRFEEMLCWQAARDRDQMEEGRSCRITTLGRPFRSCGTGTINANDNYDEAHETNVKRDK